MRRSTAPTVLGLVVLVAACGGDLPSSPNLQPRAATLSRGEESKQCEQVRGTASLTVTGPWQASGTISGGLSGSVTIATAPLVPDARGVLQGTGSHSIVTSRGTITTSDQVVLRPIEAPHYKAKATVEMVSGTGAYARISGSLKVHGEATLAPGGPIEVRYSGRICT